MRSGFLWVCLFVVFLGSNSTAAAAAADETLVPLVEMGKVKTMVMADGLFSRRQLSSSSFQVCSPCVCCGGGATSKYCLPSPCCYAINCNIPNRPFGFCSFTPKTCNCINCHI